MVGMQDLPSGDGDRVDGLLHAARVATVHSLSSLSSQSAASLNPALVRLQMVETLAEAALIPPASAGQDEPFKRRLFLLWASERALLASICVSRMIAPFQAYRSSKL